ncbi:hypothetical protein BVRB_9g215370 [Beta vulgaris subsp. vulgaris]|nr:hypothetical protein BVRB_9g215370 [Beta vulgaris subsp. vulgaris]
MPPPQTPQTQPPQPEPPDKGMDSTGENQSVPESPITRQKSSFAALFSNSEKPTQTTQTKNPPLKTPSATEPPQNFNPDSEIFIPISRDEYHELCQKWNDTIIVKPVGKSFSSEFLINSMKKIWKPKGPLSGFPIGKGFFILKFGISEDVDRIVKNGPWFLANIFIHIQKWYPGFKPSLAKTNEYPVWVTLPELPVEFQTPSFLERIGNNLGTFIKADLYALKEEKMRFGKLQVLLDIESHQKEYIWLGNVKQKISYLDWPLRCEGCNSLGHVQKNCRIIKADESSEKVDQRAGKKIRDMPEEEDGEWQQVQKRKNTLQPKTVSSRQVWEKKKPPTPLSGNSANKFNALAESHEQGIDTWTLSIEQPHKSPQPLDLMEKDLSHPTEIFKPNTSSQPSCTLNLRQAPTFHPNLKQTKILKNPEENELGKLLRFNGSQPAENRGTKQVPPRSNHNQNFHNPTDSITIQSSSYTITKILSALYNATISYPPRHLDQYDRLLQTFELEAGVGNDLEKHDPRSTAITRGSNATIYQHDDGNAFKPGSSSSSAHTDALGHRRLKPSSVCNDDVVHKETPEVTEHDNNSMGASKFRRSSSRNSAAKRTPQYYSKLAGNNLRKRNKHPEVSNNNKGRKPTVGRSLGNYEETSGLREEKQTLQRTK